jgi:NitT/TauT family transport system substrate-binding protein
MSVQQVEGWTRRRFLGGLTGAGTAGLLGLHPRVVVAEPPPETTRLRLAQLPSACRGPEWMADDLLRAEGFTDVRYAPTGGLSAWSGRWRRARRTSVATSRRR